MDGPHKEWSNGEWHNALKPSLFVVQGLVGIDLLDGKWPNMTTNEHITSPFSYIKKAFQEVS